MTEPEPDLTLFTRSPSAVGKPLRIPRPRRRVVARIVLPLLLAGAFAMVLLASAWDAIAPAREVLVMPVIATRASGAIRTGTVVCQAAGWLEPDPYPHQVTALAGGVVEEITVLEGEPVEAGQVVARLVRADAQLALQQAESMVQALEATLSAAQARLTAAREHWDNPIELTRATEVAAAASRGAAGALREHEEAVQVARARVAETEDRLRREKEVAARGVVPEFEATQTELRLKILRAELARTTARRVELEAALERARASQRAADGALRLRISEREELAVAGAECSRLEAELGGARARRDEARLRLERMEIRAPVAGVVMDLLAAPGEVLRQEMDDPLAAHVCHLYDPRRLQVRVDVPLADAALVSVGQPARVTVDVLPTRVFNGLVSRIVHFADLQKNTMEVKVRVEEPVATLKPEMLTRVQFLSPAPDEETAAASAREVVLAPREALRETSGRYLCWVVDKGARRTRQREISLGPPAEPGWVQVEEGLAPGDLLVVPDGEELVDGERITVIGEIVPEDR